MISAGTGLSSGIGFYADAIKTTTIIESKGVFKTRTPRRDDYRGGSVRLSNGDLKTYEVFDKFETVIRCSGITQATYDSLRVEYLLHREFSYFPDVVNQPARSYQVRWTGRFDDDYDKELERYSLNITLREV